MIDYIIVGSGLSGIAFAEKALQKKKSILLFEDASQNSSRVAAGLYNPVVLKRLNGVWDAQSQLQVMNEFYQSARARFKTSFHSPMPILRKFQSVEEQNNWFGASDKPNLSAFLSDSIVIKKFNHIDSPFGFGPVMQTGYVDTKALLERYQGFLSDNGMLLRERFDYSALRSKDRFVEYRSITARHIIFAEGFGVKSNPFFGYLPLEGTKGELLTIKVAGLDLDCIIKSNIFLIPLGNDFYKAGATYEWTDKTDTPTAKGRSELIKMIAETLDCNFEVISHQAGIRPTVVDRKPLLGTHPYHKNIHVLNGMGTRGVMLAPKMAEVLFDWIELGKALPAEVSIQRFTP